MDASKRLLELRNFMNKNELDLCIVTDATNQYYISGFKALLYSRPIILVIEANKTNLIIPGLEENHAKSEATVDNLYVYYEHPEMSGHGISYLEHFDSIISKYSAGTKIGVEFKAMPTGLSDYLRTNEYELVNISDKIKEMRYTKDEQELDLLVKSGELVSYTLSKSLKNANAGVSEIEFDAFGNKKLYEILAQKYPEATVSLLHMSPSGVERTNMPHVFSNTRKFKENDIIIHSRQVGLYDYHAECERTFFIGKPNDKQKDAFKAMYEAQQACLNFIKPGVKAKDVDKIGRDILQKAGFGKYAIHRIGHGIGLGMHEEPYLRFDSDLVLKEGMVFSVEPGIYIPGLGGFRHSDTVILTKNGAKIITDYPRELKDLIF